MSSKNDREHFDEYTEQNRAKHQILTEYYRPYLNALKGQTAFFHYIDGFAGPGFYDGDHPGSPLLALEEMRAAGVLPRSTISCVEKQADFASKLDEALKSSPQTKLLKAAPLVRSGAFQNHVDEILNREIYRGGTVATFAFVDPCGVDGVRLKDLSRILKLPFGEVLLFFNYEGITRLLGGIEKGTHSDKILVELFGSAERLKSVRDQLAQRSSQKELLILDEFAGALKTESEAPYFLPFRFKAKNAEKSSHYLVHFSGNRLAFKIMKEVMLKAGKGPQDKYGRLEFLSDYERGTTLDLVRYDIEAQKAKIMKRVQESQCQVFEIATNWVYHPSDSFSQSSYKQMLLELEEAGLILVYDKANENPAPVSARPRPKGLPTLGDKYWLRAPIARSEAAATPQ
jgi:three-Cys-motif partner protein